VSEPFTLAGKQLQKNMRMSNVKEIFRRQRLTNEYLVKINQSLLRQTRQKSLVQLDGKSLMNLSLRWVQNIE
jgi:hypothetical protein